jgi:serine/threonine protein kinase
MTFSTSSDVWAYGVTLFEIFTLGEMPYKGRNFGMDFVKDLKTGLRPSRPPYAPEEM